MNLKIGKLKLIKFEEGITEFIIGILKLII